MDYRVLLVKGPLCLVVRVSRIPGIVRERMTVSGDAWGLRLLVVLSRGWAFVISCLWFSRKLILDLTLLELKEK